MESMSLERAPTCKMDRRARELLRHALVALAAGGVEVGAIDGGAGIARGQNVVDAVATGAVGGDDRAAFRGQPVIAVEVAGDTVAGHAKLLRKAHALVAAGADVAGKILLGDRRVGVGGRLDGVDAVAVGADRGELVAARDGLPVNALLEGVCDVRVALAAGGGNVELGDRRFGVAGGENFVRAVAIGADGGLLRAVGDGAAVHAVLVGDEGLRAFAVRLHEKLLPVAPAAGGGNVGVIDGRLGIARALNLVNVAVAVLATGGNLSALVHFRVDAVRVGLRRRRRGTARSSPSAGASHAPGSSHPCGNPRR